MHGLYEYECPQISDTRQKSNYGKKVSPPPPTELLIEKNDQYSKF